MRGGCVIGVDLGGTKLLAAVVDGELAIHHRVRRRVGGLDQPALLATVEEAVREAVDASRQEVSAVGFGIPALVDARGTVLYCNHLPLEGLAFGAVMGERIGVPVLVDNDANLALLAEARAGAAVGARDALMLTLGTGIGGAILLGGALHRGARGSGGELGHVVVDLDGPPCQGGCPNRGCLETLASGTALEREARAATGRELTGAEVVALAQAGDGAAREVLALVGRRLGAGVSGLVNAFDPEVVVIGGGVVAAGDLLLEPARAEFAARALPPVRGVPLRAARFGEEAGVVGGAVLARESVASRAPA
jgi:glucokinase